MIGTDAAPTVLVLRALGLGDLLCGIPALRALRRAFPQHRLVLAAPAWQAQLAAGAGVDEVVDTAPLAVLDASIRHADVAVNLHGRGPQSTRLLAATGPGRLVAFAHAELGDVTIDRPVVWQPHEHEVHRWCRLLEASGIPADPTDLRLPRPPLPRPTEPGPVVVHPGAAAPGRRWPAERFGAVVGELVGRGQRVVLTGNAGERRLCERVVAAAGSVDRHAIHVSAGETDLMELAAAIADASLVVANDTGVAHLATAYGTPSVVLFGPTPPSEWGPPPSGRHVPLWAGRRGDPHAVELDPGLAEISVADVLAAAEEVTVHAVA